MKASSRRQKGFRQRGWVIAIPLHVRFWQRVQKTSNCWNWLGSTLKGYGQITEGVSADCLGAWKKGHDQTWQAHRVSWIIAFGTEPPEQVNHRCDNPLCVRPDHLFAGNPASNMQDKVAKERQARGEAIWGKLTDSAVLEIRRRYANGETNKSQLAREYGVSNPMIGYVIRRKAWKHL